MKLFKLCFLFLTVATNALSQEIDTLTYAEGEIVSAETKQPIAARIVYKSLPYGNRIGIINGSEYSFAMFDNDKYSIEVIAAGYAPAKYMLDPGDANAGKLIKDIELMTGQPVAHAPGQVMLLSNLIFEVGRSKITPESYPELDIVVGMMRENEQMIIQLEGHTDYQGSASENMKLSKQRVAAVKDYLVAKGIKKNRIHTKAFGGTQPLSRDNTPAAHRMNRRVELRILDN
ncbi:MAG TPA: OmpA family protein [Cyclobacteriaceae bacterium]|nr:OmpA family protein [Cyclobacteriaceae bacterium]